MTGTKRPVYVVCDPDEMPYAVQLAGPLSEGGFEVTHNETILIGDSLIGEAAKLLESGAPIVVCGTRRSVGNSQTHKLVNAAHSSTDSKVYVVQMEASAHVQQLSLDTKVARYDQDPARATEELVAALLQHYPPVESVAEGEAQRPLTDHFLDQGTDETTFDVEWLEWFRRELRDEAKGKYHASLSSQDFLEAANLLLGRKLTRGGVLLFGQAPDRVLPSAIIQATVYGGADRVSPALKSTRIHGPLPKQITSVLRFVGDNALAGEAPRENEAQLAPVYKYPMNAVREIIANALVHRAYEDAESCVFVRLYADRLEVESPGSWLGSPEEPDPTDIAELKGRSKCRNFRLAQLLVAVKLFEGEGSGIPRAVNDCRQAGVADPLVIRHADSVTVIVRPRSEITRPADRLQLIVGDLPGRSAAWLDRPDTLQALTDAAGTGRTTVVTALAGQRGVGKTQLAAAYARRRIEQGWPVIVWADAETEAGIISALDELAAAAGVADRGDDPGRGARAALRWLRSQPGPCLLVYDNALDVDLIREWIPTVGSVQTIVTTTHRDLGTLGDVVEISSFTSAEAVDYLGRRTGLDDHSGATELAAALGSLPLALAQAAALIGAGRRYPTYGRYLQALQQVPTSRLLPRSPGDPYPHGLGEAVLIALEDLARVDPDGNARRLLDRLSVLAAHGADGILADRLVEESDTDELAAILSGRSLVLPQEAGRLVVHRLIRRVVVESCQHAGTLDETILAVAEAILAAATDTRSRALISEYASHAEYLNSHTTRDETRERLLDLRLSLLARLDQVQNYSAIAGLGAAVLADCEATRGADAASTMRAREFLALAYRDLGRAVEAIALTMRTLTDRERVLGEDHPDTLSSRDHLALAYQAVGRVDEAIALTTRTLADRARVLGQDHPDTLRSRSNLAVAYQAVGRVDEAIALTTHTLTDRERVLGDDHPATLSSRNNLALAYQAAGRVDEAIALYTRTLTDIERVLGPDHPDTLGSRNNLALAYRDVGRTDEAIGLTERTLADRERVLGPDHPDTLSSRNNLALAYRAAGRTDEAIELQARILTDTERVFGPDHPFTRAARENLARTRQARG